MQLFKNRILLTGLILVIVTLIITVPSANGVEDPFPTEISKIDETAEELDFMVRDEDGIRKIFVYYGDLVEKHNFSETCPKERTDVIPKSQHGKKLSGMLVIDCFGNEGGKVDVVQPFELDVSGEAIVTRGQPSKRNCFTSNAVLGNELAYHVQKLREFRNNVVMQTESGVLFMDTIHKYYYAFSPTITQWEIENAVFKEAVRLAITPAIATFSILNYVDINSESEMFLYITSTVLLNVGFYFVVPAYFITKVGNKLRR